MNICQLDGQAIRSYKLVCKHRAFRGTLRVKDSRLKWRVLYNSMISDVSKAWFTTNEAENERYLNSS